LTHGDFADAAMDDALPPGDDSGIPSLSATAVLLTRARSGDVEAREELFQRFLPTLRRWAHRRLPMRARDLTETSDLVQITLLRALNRMDEFESRGEGAFLGYLRHILLNVVREEIRRSSHRGHEVPLDETLASPYSSVVEQLVGLDQMERYQRGLELLGEEQRHAVLLRVEFGYTYAQIAEALAKPSADAARMVVARAFARLARVIDDDTPRRPAA
jgi:RNA polymerase sigma factor (sigma-70 family)